MPTNQATTFDQVKLCVDCISKAFLVDQDSPKPACAARKLAPREDDENDD